MFSENFPTNLCCICRRRECMNTLIGSKVRNEAWRGAGDGKHLLLSLNHWMTRAVEGRVTTARAPPRRRKTVACSWRMTLLPFHTVHIPYRFHEKHTQLNKGRKTSDLLRYKYAFAPHFTQFNKTNYLGVVGLGCSILMDHQAVMRLAIQSVGEIGWKRRSPKL